MPVFCSTRFAFILIAMKHHSKRQTAAKATRTRSRRAFVQSSISLKAKKKTFNCLKHPPIFTTTGVYSSAARVPEAPVGCTPSPIKLGAARDLTISWLSQTESALVLDWAAGQETRAAAKAAEALARQQARQAGNAGTAAAQLVAAAGLHPPRLSSSGSSSSSWSSEEDPDDLRRADGLVPLQCDHAPFPFNRSCGVVFDLPGTAGGASGGGTLSAIPSLLPTTEVPVGMDYYTALQMAWSRRPTNPPKLPPLASEDEVNISDIDDVLSGDSDYEELSPPVPLGLMISYFAEDWRENGLYDVVQKREDALTTQNQKK